MLQTQERFHNVMHKTKTTGLGAVAAETSRIEESDKWVLRGKIPPGQERVPAITTDNGMQVINGTAEWFRLRLGPAVMDIHNLNWNAEKNDPKTGTTSPDVIRQVLYTGAPKS